MPFATKEQRKLYQRAYRQQQRLGNPDTLEGFLKAKGNCEECNRNPSVFITPENIPLCALHWSLLADSSIEWSTPISDSERTALLEDIVTHRKALTGARFLMKNLGGTWYVERQL